MIDNLNALMALAEQGTMQRAALSLHVTQSAVSKRIGELERRLDRRLIEPHGRRVELTSEGLRLVQGARPLIKELNVLLQSPKSELEGTVLVEVAVSILISWGAEALAKAQAACRGLTLKVNANHSSVAIERVRSGVSMVAIVQGQTASDLVSLPLFDQKLVIVPSGLKRCQFPKSGALPVLAIESYTDAWHFSAKQLRELKSVWGFTLSVTAELQSFSAIVQMARAGFGHGLVPEDVAITLGIPKRKLVQFPAPGISIPVSFVGRRSTLGLPLAAKFFAAVKKECN